MIELHKRLGKESKVLFDDKIDESEDNQEKKESLSNRVEQAISESGSKEGINLQSELEEKFHKVGAQVFQGVQVTVKASDRAQVDRLMQALRGLSGVQCVNFREMSNGKAVIEVASAQKPHVLARMLQEQAGLNIYIVSMSGSELKISMK